MVCGDLFIVVCIGLLWYVQAYCVLAVYIPPNPPKGA